MFVQPMTTSVGITTASLQRNIRTTLRAIIAGRRAGVDCDYADPAPPQHCCRKVSS